MLFFLLFASLGVLQPGDAFILGLFTEKTPMQDMLDVMQQLMTGDSEFDRNFIKETRSCMATFDSTLPEVHDSVWQGIIDYWDMGGNTDDPWGETPSEFAECNVTESSYKMMTIYEPCNFASNIAYYRLLNEVCERRAAGNKFYLPTEYVTAIGKALAALPVASSFLHGTNTKLGSQQDVGVISILAYLLHQGILEALPYRSTVLSDLSLAARPLTSLEILDAIQNMFSSEPVANWYDIFDALDLPHFMFSFGGIVTTMLHMNFDENFSSQLMPAILEGFGLAEEDQQFLANDFLPELKKAIPDPDRKTYFKANLLGNSVGSFAKIIHAFVWNEYRVFTFPILLEPIPNMIGWALLPKVNSKINSVMNYEYFQPDFQSGTNFYPGEQWCNRRVAHAKWHVQSAIAVLDLIYLGDEMNRLLTQTQR